MKKIFFLLTMLASVAASATVTITPIRTDYMNQKVTFSVSWTGTPYNNRVWVWIDFCPVAGTSPGTFEKAVISGATATAGSILTVSGNTRGFYVTANPSTVTATLSNASGKFNWCAYGSDYPPNVTANSGVYTLRGTPPFTLIAASGTPTQKVSGTTITTSAVTITPITLTDETGYPGDFCIYTGSDLLIDATHLCQQRASGAQNWEAWIKDARDNELYRIVLMPDNKWWLAQNVKLASYNGSTVGAAISGCTKEECGRAYTWAQIYGNYGGSYGSTGTVQGICPPNWLLPLRTTYNTLVSSIGTAQQAMRSLRPLNATCSPRQNDHGMASIIGTVNGALHNIQYWFTNDAGREDGFGIDQIASTAVVCDAYLLTNPGDSGNLGSVRCFRQL